MGSIKLSVKFSQIIFVQREQCRSTAVKRIVVDSPECDGGNWVKDEVLSLFTGGQYSTSSRSESEEHNSNQ